MDRRPLALAIPAIALSALALSFALKGMDWPAFRLQVHSLDWRWLALAVLFDIASYCAQGLRWHFLLNGATMWQTTRAIYAGLFCNEVVPLRPGEAVRAWLASRDLHVSPLSIAPTILAERLMDGLWLAAALLTALAIAPLPPALVRIAWILSAVIAALLLLAAFTRIRSALRNTRALFVSGAFLLAQGLAFWAVARASHLSLNLVAAFVVMLVVRIGTMIPGAPANIGTHQFSTVLGLSMYGIPHQAAAGYSLVVFVVLTAPLLAIGFAACLSVGLNFRSAFIAVHPPDDPLNQPPENLRNRTISTNETNIFTNPSPLTVPRK